MSSSISFSDIQNILGIALNEDIGDGDITSDAVFTGSERSDALIVSKQKGIFCGGMIAGHVYSMIDPGIECVQLASEGEAVIPGTEVMRFQGPSRGILTGERTVLNFMQRMCGIATTTGEYASILAGTGIKILDTRKTAPGMRILDKYAVRAGGGTNHRMGLHDMVMIKDNHIRAAGSITEAVRKVREAHGDRYRIEVEAATLDEVREALASKPDIIMLDNMELETINEAVSIVRGIVKIELSGNMTKEKVEKMKNLAVDYISIGALTHSVTAFDLSMKFL